MVHYISFPGLFDNVFAVPQEAFFGIRWYAIMIMTGFLLAALYGMKRAKEFGSNGDQVADILLISLPAAIIGARIYYVAYMWDYYSQHTDEIIRIWDGGIAIYGGIIAAVLAVIIYGKIKKMDIPSFLDMGGIGLLLGQAIGRWGNFFNAEAFGTTTDLPWGMVIRTSMMQQGTPVHPTFFYEFAWNLIGFGLLHFYSKKRKFKGEIFLMYIAWYGLGRSFIEGLRTDSLMWGDVRVSQALAIASCAIAVIILLYKYISKKYVPITADTYAPVVTGEAAPEVAETVAVPGEPLDTGDEPSEPINDEPEATPEDPEEDSPVPEEQDGAHQ